MHFHHRLDTSSRAVAKHQARIQESRASSATRSVKATSRKKKGDSNLASAPIEPVNTPTPEVSRDEDAQVSREPHSAMIEGVDLDLSSEDAIDSEPVVSDSDSDSDSNPTTESDVEEVVERPVIPNGLINWFSNLMWALLGAFWRLLGLIWGVLKWLMFC